MGCYGKNSTHFVQPQVLCAVLSPVPGDRTEQNKDARTERRHHK